MRIIIFKILASLSFGIVCGAIAVAVILHSSPSQEFQQVTFEDLKAYREMKIRVADALKGGAALPEVDSRVTLFAVGDVMLSRMVAERMIQNGPDYPFQELGEQLRAAHITFGNLESPISAGRHIQSTEMVFRADPESADALAAAGFDVVSLANNHIMNFGAIGLADTMQYLDNADIAHVGAGKSPAAAREAKIIERGGLKFAFLAYSYSARHEEDVVASLSIELMREDLAETRKQADYVIVSMHAGAEYAHIPNARQVEFAHAAVDAGADVVLGHHPHVVQTAEVYNGKHIFYSLGNFVFDQMWSWDTRRGLGVCLTFSETGIEDVQYVPIIIDDYAKPRLANEHETMGVLGRLGSTYLKNARQEQIE